MLKPMIGFSQLSKEKRNASRGRVPFRLVTSFTRQDQIALQGVEMETRYATLSNKLTKRIGTGEYRVGEYLPSETAGL